MQRSIIAILAPCVLIVGLASCKREPVSVEAAMASCENTALQAAAPPKTTIGFGFNSSGEVRSGVVVSASADYLAGRRPADVFAECVVKRSGEQPTRSLAEQLDQRTKG